MIYFQCFILASVNDKTHTFKTNRKKQTSLDISLFIEVLNVFFNVVIENISYNLRLLLFGHFGIYFYILPQDESSVRSISY